MWFQETECVTICVLNSQTDELKGAEKIQFVELCQLYLTFDFSYPVVPVFLRCLTNKPGLPYSLKATLTAKWTLLQNVVAAEAPLHNWDLFQEIRVFVGGQVIN